MEYKRDLEVKLWAEKFMGKHITKGEHLTYFNVKLKF